jgi:hypothetical protein
MPGSHRLSIGVFQDANNDDIPDSGTTACVCKFKVKKAHNLAAAPGCRPNLKTVSGAPAPPNLFAVIIEQVIAYGGAYVQHALLS